MYFVGIDWSDLHHDVAVLDEKGQELKYFTIPHSRKGMELLKERLLSIDPEPENFACLLETKNGLLVQFLLEAGFPVYPLNPKVVDYRRKPFLQALSHPGTGKRSYRSGDSRFSEKA